MSSAVVTQQAQPDGRRGRRIRRIVVVLAVLAGLLVGADFALAAFAEHTVSQKAREELGLTDDPSVTINGFPFTTQALSGEYDHITVSAQGVPVGPLKDVAMRAELRDVTAPLEDLTSGNMRAIRIGELEGQVTLKASDIARVEPLTKIEDLRIEPSSEDYVRSGEGSEDDSRDGSGSDSDSGTGSESGTDAGSAEDSTAGVRLSGYARIAGERIEIFAFAMIELDGSTIRITPQRLQFGNDKETTVVPPQVQDALLPNFEADISTGGLPFTVTPTAVEVQSGSITIKGEASNVKFVRGAKSQ